MGTPDEMAALAVVLATVALLILVFNPKKPDHPLFWLAMNLTTYVISFAVLLT